MQLGPVARRPPSSFQRDEDPAYYGRFRLWFDQVTPWVDDGRALLRVLEGQESLVHDVYRALEPDQSWPIDLVGPADGAVEGAEELEPGRSYVVLEMFSDVCYIDTRNLHRALDAFAPSLADARFFAYSSGDGLDDWLDEYEIRSRGLVARRWTHEPNLRQSRLSFYAALARASPGDRAIRQFAIEMHRRQADFYRARGAWPAEVQRLTAIADDLEQQAVPR